MFKHMILMGFAVVLVTTKISAAAAQDSLEDRVARLEQSVETINEQIKVMNDNSVQIMQLNERLKAAISEVQDVNARQNQLLSPVIAQDTEGNTIIRIDSIMKKSATARNEFRLAVERSTRDHGMLTVANKMATDQSIVVNGTQYLVHTGASLPIRVAVGNVHVRLPGQDAVNWMIGPANNYHQRIDINPSKTAYRVSKRPSEISYVESVPRYYYSGFPHAYYSYSW